MDISQLSDQDYVLLICDYVLQYASSREQKFDFLLGDPGKNNKSRKLPVDAYYESLKLVIEYQEYQHYESTSFFDKPEKLTISGISRQEQRKIYDNRRKELLPLHGITLIEIPYYIFEYNSHNRINRNLWNDVSKVRDLLMEYVALKHCESQPKKVFSRNSNIDWMAFMNWRIEPNDYILNMKNVADGFLLSSQELTSSCLTENRNKKADILIFPIFHNLNHGIELYLKCLIWIANKKIGSSENFDGTHDIKKLFKTLNEQIYHLKNYITIEEFKGMSNSLIIYIDELYEKISLDKKHAKMDFPRYPFDLNFQDQFYALDKGTIEIDLENFVERISIIKEHLQNLFRHLYSNESQKK